MVYNYPRFGSIPAPVFAFLTDMSVSFHHTSQFRQSRYRNVLETSTVLSSLTNCSDLVVAGHFFRHVWPATSRWISGTRLCWL